MDKIKILLLNDKAIVVYSKILRSILAIGITYVIFRMITALAKKLISKNKKTSDDRKMKTVTSVIRSSLDAWITEAKSDPLSSKCGMYLDWHAGSGKKHLRRGPGQGHRIQFHRFGSVDPGKATQIGRASCRERV